MISEAFLRDFFKLNGKAPEIKHPTILEFAKALVTNYGHLEAPQKGWQWLINLTLVSSGRNFKVTITLKEIK